MEVQNNKFLILLKNLSALDDVSAVGIEEYMLNSKVNALTENDIVEMVTEKNNRRKIGEGDKKNPIPHSDTFKTIEAELKYTG